MASPRFLLFVQRIELYSIDLNAYEAFTMQFILVLVTLKAANPFDNRRLILALLESDTIES